MSKAVKNRVHGWVYQVNYDVICNRLSELNMTKAAVSRQLGYTSNWLGNAILKDGKIRTKDAMELCELLGLNLDDIVIKENQPKSVSEVHQTEDLDEIVKVIDKQTATINARMNSLNEDVKQLRDIADEQKHYIYQVGVLLQKVIDMLES